jgi:predicted outer membrane repeat protein
LLVCAVGAALVMDDRLGRGGAGGAAVIRLVGRRVLTVAVVVTLLLVVGVAQATAAQTLYAYATGTATTASCPQSATFADECSLATALADAGPGDTVELETANQGGGFAYVGNWSIATPGTSSSAPVTITAATGFEATLSGNPSDSSSDSCSTASCSGTILTVGDMHLDLHNVTIEHGDNTSSNEGPGGLSNDQGGTVAITDCSFTANTGVLGGAIGNADDGAAKGIGSGDGQGTLTVSDSTFSDNAPNGEGGAIDSGDLGGAGSVTVTDSTFSDNTASAITSGNDGGGGSVTVSASTFSGNSSTDGGAIDSGQAGGGSVTVADSTFSGDTASNDGGAIDSGMGLGPGLLPSGGGSVVVTNSTFSHNTAGDNGGAIDSGDDLGGGSAAVSDSTFSGNTATNFGNAIASASAGTDKRGTTVGGTVWVAGDVFADTCSYWAGTVEDQGYNAGAASCENGGVGDVTSSSLDLGSLAENGGPTETVALGAGSPAIGMIPEPASVTLNGASVALCPVTDQRGYSRPGAGASSCDAGAFETGGTPPTFYAYASGAATTATCPQTSTTADQCSLATALADVSPGDTVVLATPDTGGGSAYVGNWSVDTLGTSSGVPVTLTAPAGSNATLSARAGDNSSDSCSTGSCDGTILTVGDMYLDLSNVAIEHGDTPVYGYDPGGLSNDQGGTVAIADSTFTGNSGGEFGGAIDNADGGPSNDGGYGDGQGTLTVSDSTFSGNTAGEQGGAIDSGDEGGRGSVTVSDSTFSGNAAGNGGAIESGHNMGGGSVTVSGSTFSANTASIDGGAIDSGHFRGGGSVMVSDSTFSANTAEDGGAIGSGAGPLGGGSVTVSESTFSGNSATQLGDAIFAGGTVTVAGDVFADACLGVAQTIDDQGYNVGSSSCFSGGPGDVTSASLDLGSLADNGGSTQTMALESGSPAIGVIPDATGVTVGGSSVALCPASDQRGAPRPGYGASSCDAGAFETGGVPPVEINELRLTGPSADGGLSDRYVDLANTSGSAVALGGMRLAFADGSGNSAAVSLSGSIPAYGHYLVADTGYVADSALNANAGASPDLTASFGSVGGTGGVELLDASEGSVDAIGFVSAPAGYHAGVQLTVPSSLPSGEFAWVRKFADGALLNTGDNASDFVLVSTSAASDPPADDAVLGAPGPQDSGSEVVHNDILQSSLLDPVAAEDVSPNMTYTAGSDGQPGTLIINRVLTNCSATATAVAACVNGPGSGSPAETATRLRFRITGLSTVGSNTGTAVLDAEASSGESALTWSGGSGSPLGLPLDAPSTAGEGGLNSTLTATADLPAGGLTPGASVDVEFEFRVVTTGSFTFAYNTEDDLVPATATTPTGSSGSPAQAIPVAPVVSGTVSPTGVLTASSPPVTTAACRAELESLEARPGIVRRGHKVRLQLRLSRACAGTRAVTISSRAFAPRRRPARTVHAKTGDRELTLTVMVPASRQPGRYAIIARAGGSRSVSIRLDVTGSSRRS